MDASNYLYISALLFTIGAVGVVVRRNAIVVFMCIELMLNAANLSFVTFFSNQWKPRWPSYGLLYDGCSCLRGCGWSCNYRDDLPITPISICR